MTKPASDDGSQVLTDEFEVFVHGSVKRLFGRAYWRCAQWHLAEDLVQETYFRLWKVWPVRSDVITEKAACSNKVLDRVCIDYYRRTRTEVTTEALPEVSGVDADEGQEAQRDKIRRAVTELPPQQRELMCLHYFKGMSLAETAAAMGIAEKTAYNYHTLAKNRLRNLITGTHDVTANRRSAETEST